MWFGVLIYGFFLWGDLICSYSFAFLLILNRSCNGGLCFWPSCIIRDIINPVPEPVSALLGSWPWHWIHLAVPPGAIGGSSFLPPFQAISVCVQRGHRGDLPLALSSPPALAPAATEELSSRLPLPRPGSAISVLFTLWNCYSLSDPLRHSLVSEPGSMFVLF